MRKKQAASLEREIKVGQYTALMQLKQQELCKQKGRPSECPHSYLLSDH